jgi:hypothetical protein
MFKMEEETVTLPKPPEGFKYTLVRERVNTVRDKDPSELTPRQLATLKYNEKNRQKINEKSRLRYHEKKNSVNN